MQLIRYTPVDPGTTQRVRGAGPQHSWESVCCFTASPLYLWLCILGFHPPPLCSATVCIHWKKPEYVWACPAQCSLAYVAQGSAVVSVCSWDRHHEMTSTGLPSSTSRKEPACLCSRCKRLGFDPCVGKIPWRMKGQPTPGFLPGESHGQKSLAGYSPRGSLRVAYNLSDLANDCK